MAPDHFLGNRLDDAAEIKKPLLLGDAGLKNDLEEKVALKSSISPRATASAIS
jgi:hypothetical protein